MGLTRAAVHEALLGTPKADGGKARSGRSTPPKRGKCEEAMPKCDRTPFLTARTSVTTASAGRSSAAEKTPASSVAAGTFDAAIRRLPHHLQASKAGSQEGIIDPPPEIVPCTDELRSGCYSDPSRANSSHSAVPQARDNESSSSAWLPAALSDPRVDGLCERVRALERMLNHLLKSSKVTEDSSPGATFQTPLRSSVPDEDDDANQFAVRVTAQDDLSLSSQVAAMSALLSRPPSPRPGSGKQNVRGEVLVEFPDPSALQHLLDVYFRDLDNYFPFLDRQDTESRIYSVISRLGCSSYNRMLVVNMEDLSIIALACIMLALAECLDTDEGACDGDTKPGWERYLQSCRAIEHFSHSKTLDLHVVRAQCLVAAYLMHCEILSAASEAISVAWKLATSIRLNNSKAWPAEDVKETLQKQKLWWTIYFLDRQISRRSGTAYHIRDTEFNVDDFTLNGNAVDDTLVPQTDWHSSLTRSYLQALINSARLWGHVWDTFFAVGATKKGDWMEVEIMDARILNTRRQLPRALTWDSDELANYTLSDDEPHIRRRLQLFTVSVPDPTENRSIETKWFAETGTPPYAHQTEPRSPGRVQSRNGSSLCSVFARDHQGP
jgi:Fungal specific transcription factor domain